ncbi:BsuPI-related putative proteinase inhibitor [Halolamina salifodinae]|uniref:Intracellular proteinase inhibitor BsuPI domain-containing protein n=1 Tax=Halolamina salifodinae TaxID=1202767 RepID=A0A8T4GX15_9EURY|nr:BsuPI-related putative proteinase inhibitor [Halolamina salifodinae]MBP1987459.1 hypothetical protein [Halolamina salifodinae]
MLEATLTSQPRGDSLAFELRVENHGDEAAELSFPDAQRLRVTVSLAAGGDDADPVWRSDADRMFAQVVGTETVPAGESVTFETAWKEPEPGEYLAVGEVTCQDREIRDEETLLT